MNGSTGSGGGPRDTGERSLSAADAAAPAAGLHGAEAADGLAPSEAFQTLASEVRVAVIVELLAAERRGETPVSFSSLQASAGGESSAGFAYHLRQLSDHFVRDGEAGYVLTPAGRRAARAVVDGAFTGGGQAS